MKDVMSRLSSGDLANKKSTMSSKGIKQKIIKDYDFKLPKKFTKEQLRTLLGVNEIYARHLSSYLTATLRTFCRVDVTAVEETKYIEYTNLMHDSSLLGIFELNPFEGNVLMELSQELTFVIIDMMLGGIGNCDINNRDYTDIEMVLMKRFFKNIISFFTDAWSGVADVEPVFIKTETSNGANQVMHLDEVVVAVTLNVNIKETSGKISVILPYVWLESINDKLYTRFRLAEKKNDVDSETTKKVILEKISRTSIFITAILGNTMIRTKDLMNLEVGDIIRLNEKPGDFVKLNVGSKTWYYANLGLKNSHKAVKIVKSLHEEM
ncbi:MAG: flagellar motor switch protein FliM [Oscillospiraceae bacterium]|nr:flagellar motor switch protein FliM [Oscillospiraceae bacterium]